MPFDAVILTHRHSSKDSDFTESCSSVYPRNLHSLQPVQHMAQLCVVRMFAFLTLMCSAVHFTGGRVFNWNGSAANHARAAGCLVCGQPDQILWQDPAMCSCSDSASCHLTSIYTRHMVSFYLLLSDTATFCYRLEFSGKKISRRLGECLMFSPRSYKYC